MSQAITLHLGDLVPLIWDPHASKYVAFSPLPPFQAKAAKEPLLLARSIVRATKQPCRM